MKPLPHPDNQHLEAAEGWLGLGDRPSANEELEQISPAFRDHPFVLEVRYKIFAEAKRWDEAVEIARTLSEMLPDNSWGFIHYAYSLHELKRTREAYGVLIPVVDKFSEPTIRYNLACYACQLGNLKEAEQWLKKAIDLVGKKDVRKMALADPDLKPLWSKIGEI
jgi:predicted Zn-dependent protease